jgi:PqqD family protein of HPr-rel-A system
LIDANCGKRYRHRTVDVFWTDASPEAVRVKQWDGDPLSIVYQPLSGDTHLLDPLPVELLRLVGAQPQTLAQLAAELADALCALDTADALDLLENSLVKLQEMGLVQRRSS